MLTAIQPTAGRAIREARNARLWLLPRPIDARLSRAEATLVEAAFDQLEAEVFESLAAKTPISAFQRAFRDALPRAGELLHAVNSILLQHNDARDPDVATRAAAPEFESKRAAGRLGRAAAGFSGALIARMMLAKVVLQAADGKAPASILNNAALPEVARNILLADVGLIFALWLLRGPRRRVDEGSLVWLAMTTVDSARRAYGVTSAELHLRADERETAS